MFCQWKSTTILLENIPIQIKRNPIVMLLGSWCHWFSWVFTHDASEGSMDFEHFKIFLNSRATLGWRHISPWFSGRQASFIFNCSRLYLVWIVRQVHDSVYEEQIMEAFKVFDYVSSKCLKLIIEDASMRHHGILQEWLETKSKFVKGRKRIHRPSGAWPHA